MEIQAERAWILFVRRSRTAIFEKSGFLYRPSPSASQPALPKPSFIWCKNHYGTCLSRWERWVDVRQLGEGVLRFFSFLLSYNFLHSPSQSLRDSSPKGRAKLGTAFAVTERAYPFNFFSTSCGKNSFFHKLTLPFLQNLCYYVN